MQEEGLGEWRDSDSECEWERECVVEGVSELVSMGIWELRHPRHANRQTIYCATSCIERGVGWGVDCGVDAGQERERKSRQ